MRAPGVRVRVNGVDLVYEEQGQGMPLLFIHGGYGGPSSTLWLGPRFPWHGPLPGFRTIAYDRRCAGQSAYIDQPFSLRDVANDAIGLLDALNIARAVIVASSAGGMVALELALSHPERVAALVLVNTGAAIMHTDPRAVPGPPSPFVRDRLATVRERAEILALLESDGMEVAVASCWEEWRHPQPRDLDGAFADHRTALEASLASTSDAEIARLAAGAVLNMRAMIDIDLTPTLLSVATPTLVLHGDHDTVVPFEYGQVLGQLIPQADFQRVGGGRSWPPRLAGGATGSGPVAALDWCLATTIRQRGARSLRRTSSFSAPPHQSPTPRRPTHCPPRAAALGV